jgi:hypothetical protein
MGVMTVPPGISARRRLPARSISSRASDSTRSCWTLKNFRPARLRRLRLDHVFRFDQFVLVPDVQFAVLGRRPVGVAVDVRCGNAFSAIVVRRTSARAASQRHDNCPSPRSAARASFTSW